MTEKELKKEISELEKKMLAYIRTESLFKLRLDERLRGFDKKIDRLGKGMPHINFGDDNV